jgi:hypothetical protein
MTQPARSLYRRLCALSLIIAIGITGYAIWRTSGGFGTAAPKFGQQSADSPLVMPEQGTPDMRFHFPAAWIRIGTPKASRFDFPAGSENGALLKSGAPGEFTGIGGTNMALGDPVFAAADGTVVYNGEPSSELGKVVMIEHTAPDGKTLRSVYGRLDKSEVSLGSFIARGAKIGTMGTANGHFPAGLLFDLGTGDIGTGFTPTPGSDPREALGKLRNAAPEALAPSALSRM